MKLLLSLLFIYFDFFSISKEEVIIKTNKVDCPIDFKNALIDILILDENFMGKYYNDYYGLNAQNCGIMSAGENKCCYISLFSNENWYYYCAGYNLENDINTLINSIIDDEYEGKLKEKNLGDKEKIKENIKKGINLDCFSKKLNIIKSFIFILLTLTI